MVKCVLLLCLTTRSTVMLRERTTLAVLLDIPSGDCITLSCNPQSQIRTQDWTPTCSKTLARQVDALSRNYVTIYLQFSVIQALTAWMMCDSSECRWTSWKSLRLPTHSHDELIHADVVNAPDELVIPAGDYCETFVRYSLDMWNIL